MVKSIKSRISTDSLPFLEDHGFQNLVVMPGSMYISLAAEHFQQVFGPAPNSFKQVIFRRVMLVTPNNPIELIINIEGEADGARISFTDSEGEIDNPYATLWLSYLPQVNKNNDHDREIADLEWKELAGGELYEKLLQNGNEYGAWFKVVDKLKIEPNAASGEINVTDSTLNYGNDYPIHPILLDACVQVLAAINLHLGKTFVLQGFESLQIHEIPSSGFNCQVQITESNQANFQAYCKDGRLLFSAIGVKFDYLENTISNDKQEQIINLVATFTIDPIEDSIRFWQQTLSTPVKTQVGPYNQVFQQLLDPNSNLNKPEKALNVIALNIEDWTGIGTTLKPLCDSNERESIFGPARRYQLPNGAEIAHLNRYETDYVFKEIFLDKCYLKHGVTINDGDCIVDIGANIGLFTLFVNQQCKDPKVYSFEPSPQVYDLLKANAQIYGSNSKTFNLGISDEKKESNFTFYENSSVFSSFNADEKMDRDAISAVIRNMVKDSLEEDHDSIDAYVDEMMENRMSSQMYSCQLASLSDIIEEQNIEKIDLLKIDAEKSELDILKGIKEQHWDRIKQIVLEVHDTEGGTIEEIRQILISKGFTYEIEEETFLQNSGLYNVFAKRKEASTDLKIVNSFEKDIREQAEGFIRALEAASVRSSNPFLVLSCHWSSSVTDDPEKLDLFQRVQSDMAARIAELNNVRMYGTQSIDKLYPVSNYFDSEQNALGHISYTPDYYSALGSMVFRYLRATNSDPFKVIAVDCDNTLWSGVVGEVGPMGIEITEGHIFSSRVLNISK